MNSILDDFAAAVARHPQRIAIVDGTGRDITFAQLQARADDFASAWHTRGIRKGDQVLLAMGIGIDLYASLAALWSLGATVVLPEPAMGIAGLRHAARVTNVSAFCSSGFYGLLKFVLPELWSLRHLRPSVQDVSTPDLPATGVDDIALISFTSGTTGTPKAIPRSHGFLMAQHNAIAPLLHSKAVERDLVAFPVFVLINIASGQTSVLPNWKMSRLAQLEPKALQRWTKDQNVTRALLPPSLCEKLVATDIPASLHTIFTGGGPVFPDILNDLNMAKTDLRVICVYGSTEAEPIAHLDAKDIDAQDHANMISGHGLLVGHPVDDIRIRIAEGEIQVAGPHVNNGYLDPNHDAENKIKDGALVWHRTGDTGYVDSGGRLWLLGRKGSDIATPHGTAYPFSVEVAARQWDGVQNCALLEADRMACLVIMGDVQHIEEWRAKAEELDIAKVTHVTQIPMDRRHASKIDRTKLRRLTRI